MRQNPKKICWMTVPGEWNERNKAQKPNQNEAVRAQVGNKKKSKKVTHYKEQVNPYLDAYGLTPIQLKETIAQK